MFKLSLLDRLGNAFAVLFGSHGAVTAQADSVGCSRQTAYDNAAHLQQTLTEAEAPGPSRTELLAENETLRAEAAELRQQRGDSVLLSEHVRHRLAVTASSMGLSYNQIEELFALLCTGAKPGPDRSTIARWVRRHAQAAAAILELLDEQARPHAKVLAVDEIFFHGKPVLMGVEPASMALLLCQRSKDRTGETWREALKPFRWLDYAISDQGNGLQAGLRLLKEMREADREAYAKGVSPQAEPPLLENGLDLFHLEQEAQRVLGRSWKAVEACGPKYERARRQQGEGKEDGRTLAAAVRRAWEEVELAWWWYDEQKTVWKRVRAALQRFRPDGQLNDRAWAAAELAEACAELSRPEWAKVRRLLQDERLLTFLDRLHRQLEEAVPERGLREMLVRLWGLERGPQSGGRLGTCVAQRVLCSKLSADWEEGYRKVAAALSGVVRASSAVECVNSVLRMQQARHRNLNQEMLDLKRLYWNCRTFRGGKRARACPYQHLGVVLPSYDFWDLLGRNPAELRQELSSQRLAG